MDKKYDLSGLSFLVVERNRFMRSLITSVLESLGVTTLHEAESCTPDLALIKNLRPDIITSCWQMTGTTGLEIARSIRQSKVDNIRFTPFILITAYASKEHIKDAINAGVSEYIIKPFNAMTIYNHIKNIIEKPRPYIEATDYFGPDRRRCLNSTNYQDDRRKKDIVKAATGKTQ